MLAEMERARAISPEEWAAEKGEREALLKKKKDAVELPSNIAAGNVTMLRRAIFSHTVKTEKFLGVRQ